MAEEMSLREQLIAARDEVLGADEPEAPEPKAEAVTKEVTDVPENVTEEPVKETASGRDEKGRFVSTKPQAQEAPQEPPAPAIEPPQSWTAAEKALWSGLSIEAQRTIARREADAHKAITRHDEERAFAKQFKEATAPYEAQLRAMNTTPIDAYRTLLNATYILRTGTPQQKYELLMKAAADAGIDLRQVAQGQGQSQQPAQQQFAQLPPQVLAELQETRKWREQMAAEKQQAETAAYNNIVAEIDTFRADPAHPHFDSVRETMVSLIQTGLAPDLKSAYEQATWAVPSIRAELLSKANAGQARSAKVAQAKQKAGSVRGGPGASPDATAPKDRTVREELQAAFADARGRV